MASKTKKRLRRAAKKLERQRRAALGIRNPARPRGRSIGPDDLFPPAWPDDSEGGAGVREPRRPFPTTPAGAIALEPPAPTYLDLVS
jgi:hypothetical protein